MNIEEYISSGILELYGAGALTASEKAEVEQLGEQHPEIKAELNLIRHTLDQYAALHAVEPPPALKEKVLRAVFQPETNHRSENQTAPANAETNPRVIPIGRVANQTAASTAFKWLVAASLTLLVMSNALSYYFYRNWQESDQNLQLALSSQQEFAQNFRRVQQKLSANQKALALLNDSNTLRVELKGVEKSPDSRVTLYWHRLTKDVYVNVDNLPAPPTGKQYQLWALVDGKPVDAGIVKSTDITADLHHMKDVQQAQAFAITLEPQGGSINPTLTEMYVMGKI
ncbi:MAG: hypothetical protein JWQ14_3013 [Adhaeribacter sp.]|nr:hypothetical protein [Adhaeribacter sp.]